jgi:hypothetical protein
MNLTCFALKRGISWKMIKRDELRDFHDFVVFSRWNVTVCSTALICDLEVYLVEALDLVYLILVQSFQLFWMLWFERRTLLKMVLLNRLPYKSFMNGFIWLIDDMWMIVDDWIWCLSWNDVLIHFTWFMKSIWNCYDIW